MNAFVLGVLASLLLRQLHGSHSFELAVVAAIGFQPEVFDVGDAVAHAVEEIAAPLGDGVTVATAREQALSAQIGKQRVRADAGPEE